LDSSLFLVEMFVGIDVYTSYGLILLFMTLGLKGYILVILNPLFKYFLNNDWSKLLSIKLTKVNLLGS
jgi:hypothetical protein